jgi:hypothetical protein
MFRGGVRVWGSMLPARSVATAFRLVELRGLSTALEDWTVTALEK